MKDFSLVHHWLLDTTEWFRLGITLGLSYVTLETILIDHREQVDMCRCAMIHAWLCEKDCVKDKGGCTKQALVSALRTLKQNVLANKIAGDSEEEP